MEKQKRFKWIVRPLADEKNIYRGKSYRITVLTGQLFRLEYDENGVFEDRASQSVFYRDFPANQFESSVNNGILHIKTSYLELTYQENKPFSEETLSIKLLTEPGSEWKFGSNFEDLGGTARTLDQADGEIPLGRGVCSRFGFSVIDDSHSMLLNDEGWVETRKNGTADYYFFGYGYNYIQAVKDYYRLTGIPPMLPAYALGNWWSRYYKYTQQEYIDLMERFKNEDIPFSVGVVDMDWHTTELPEDLTERLTKKDQRLATGWTGYTWNTDYFPDYKEFLKYLNDNNIKTSLNLHPAQGIRKHEAMFEEMAKAMGIDPDSTDIIPFDILSQKFMSNYFDVLHHPYEESGVNFWWMDWQQGTDYWWIHKAKGTDKSDDDRETLDPLWMLNHLHIMDISRNNKRPMFFSRFSGVGSQRYPVGFSGDTFVTWASLEFQPYFTATASNIGYCWWSHDIGGHMCGYRDDELTTRWIQLGVFSPINRLHSSNNEFLNKEPWNYPTEHEFIQKKWLRMRHELFPYIYTMNYRTHHELLPLVQPMYYSYPKCSAAYEVKNQYMFGSELMVCPITEPRNKIDMLSKADAWIPDGDWFDFFDGTHYHSDGGRKMQLFRSLENYPVLAKSGAIVPMTVRTPHDNRLINSESIKVVVFPNASNTFSMYEDSGEYSSFEDGAFCLTKMNLEWGKIAKFTISPASGDVTLIPKRRTWEICFRGTERDVNVCTFINDIPVKTESKFDEQTNTVSVIVEANTNEAVTVNISGDNLINSNKNVYKRCFEILRNSQIEIIRKNRLYDAVKDSDLSVHAKIMKLGVNSAEDYHLKGALKEQLTLTCEEYK